jgi:hypothetical protein
MTATIPTTLELAAVDGGPLTVPLDLLGSIVVTGPGRRGKTSVLRSVFAQLAPSPAVQFVGIGQADELESLAPRFAALLSPDRVTGPRLLGQVRAEMSRRRDELWCDSRADRHHPTPDTPLLVVLVDECAAVLDTPAAAELAADLARFGRAAGIASVWTTAHGRAGIPAAVYDTAAAVIELSRTGAPGTATITTDTTDPTPATVPLVTAAAAIDIATTTADRTRAVRGVTLGTDHL